MTWKIDFWIKIVNVKVFYCSKIELRRNLYVDYSEIVLTLNKFYENVLLVIFYSAWSCSEAKCDFVKLIVTTYRVPSPTVMLFQNVQFSTQI